MYKSISGLKSSKKLRILQQKNEQNPFINKEVAVVMYKSISD